MSDKLFYRLLFAVVVVGAVITLAHAAYMVYAYPNSSIIHFVSKELW